MATWQRANFASIEQMINFLNGALIGTENLADGAEVDGLDFIYDIGAGGVTVDFTPAKNRAWTAAEIAAQINASLAGSTRVYSHNSPFQQLRGVDQRILMERDGALTIKKTGSANTLLGFSTADDSVADPIATTEVESIQYKHMGATNMWVVVLYR